jgi:hypothetical protein
MINCWWNVIIKSKIIYDRRMRFKLKTIYNYFDIKTKHILISDDNFEQDLKQFVQKNLEYFHLFYNLFQNMSYYFVKQTKEKIFIKISRKIFPNFSLVDLTLHGLFDLQLNQFYSRLDTDVPYLIQSKNHKQSLAIFLIISRTNLFN